MQWNKILEQNPWWSGLIDKDIKIYTDRNLKILRKNLELKPDTIYLIKGPRRVGKTIYLKLIAQNNNQDYQKNRTVLYINLDTIRIKRKELERNIESFVANKPYTIILLDEIKLEDNALFLKGFKDLGTFSNSTVIVTGSDPRVIEKCRQALIGRAEETKIMAPLNFRQFLFNVLPSKEEDKLREILLETKIIPTLDNSEILKQYEKLEPYFKKLEQYLDIYLLTGGFPESINNYFDNLSIGKQYIEPRFYEDIIEKIFEKMDKKKSIEILKVLFQSITSSVKYSTIKNKTEYSIPTIKEYLFNLSELLLIFDIKENPRELSKKFYFRDPFVMHSVNNYYSDIDPFNKSLNLILDDTAKSIFIENLVASTFFSLYNLNLGFYRDKKNNKEVDFIIDKKAIEVKYRSTITKPNYIENATEYITLTRYPLGPADIVVDNRLAIPVCIFLAMIEEPRNYL